MDLGLAERVVLVVGATGVLGGAVAERLRGEGAVVVAAARHPDAGGLALDAGDDASVSAAVARVLADHGRIDGLVVAAAPPASTIPADRSGDPEIVGQAFAAKALTFLRVANAVLPAMTAAGFGRVVAVSGQNAVVTGSIAGSVRNAAVIIEAQSLADQVTGTGVTVNVVNPGTVAEHPSPDVATGKPGEASPTDVADLVAYLVSPLAGGISGASIPVGHRVRGTVSL